MGLVDGKSVTGNRRDKVDSGQDNVVQTGFLLKAGQDDQIFRVGLRNLIIRMINIKVGRVGGW